MTHNLISLQCDRHYIYLLNLKSPSQLFWIDQIILYEYILLFGEAVIERGISKLLLVWLLLKQSVRGSSIQQRDSEPVW